MLLYLYGHQRRPEPLERVTGSSQGLVFVAFDVEFQYIQPIEMEAVESVDRELSTTSPVPLRI